MVEYAKAAPDDILARITVTNRSPEAADCFVLPTLWFRNTWSWGYENAPMNDVAGKPHLNQIHHVLDAHPLLDEYVTSNVIFEIYRGS